MDLNKIYHGDCLEVLKRFDSNMFDSVITDPPYGLSKQPDILEVLTHWMNDTEYRHPSKGFMGKSWDSFVPSPVIWKEVFRVMKPGATALIFAGSRTQDLMSISLRMAGFEIRDTIMWMYAQGFPKSQDISKFIDKKLGAVREFGGVKSGHEDFYNRDTTGDTNFKDGMDGFDRPWLNDEKRRQEYHLKTIPSTPEATLWDGWWTALKPAYEPILVGMKPLDGTYAENALKWGVSGINIGESKVPINLEVDKSQIRTITQAKRVDDISGQRWGYHKDRDRVAQVADPGGRYPSNVILDEYSANLLDNSGGTSRFFYCPKASKGEKNRGLSSENKNTHPTVKPLALMEYLCTLTKTPTGGLVLDPFMGSGTTAVACINTGRNFVGIEKEEEYVGIAKKRVAEAEGSCGG